MDEFAILPFILFCFVATATPGPNNMINLAQGVHLGMWQALPFAMGTGFGVASLLIAMALGLGAAVRALPWLYGAMQAITFMFLIYLAWKLATSGPVGADSAEQRLGFAGGVAFQWINPKTWASAMTMATTFLPSHPSVSAALLAGAIFCLVAWLVQPIWIGLGTSLRLFLSESRRATVFNVAMATLLLATTLPVLLSRT